MEYQILLPYRGLLKLSSFGSDSIPPEGVMDFFECRMIEDTDALLSSKFILPSDEWMIQDSFWNAVKNQEYLVYDDWGREIYRSVSWKTREYREMRW